MQNPISRIRVWGLILLLYLVAGAIILPKLDIHYISNLWVLGMFILIILVLVQVRKVDKITPKDKKLKESVNTTFIKPLKYFIIGTILLFVVYWGLTILGKFYNLDLQILKITLVVLIIIVFYWILWKKKIGWFSKK